MVGRIGRTIPGRSYQVPGRTARPRGGLGRDSGYPVTACPDPARLGRPRARPRASCSPPAAAQRRASFDPTGACTGDGRAAGPTRTSRRASRRPTRRARPDTLDSGRNCSADNLGTLADAGHRRRSASPAGRGRSAASGLPVLAVFTRAGPDADALADFYEAAPVAAGRTITGQSEPTIAGRPGHRLDTQDRRRVQTVVVWPAAAEDVVNVVITNDLPDARIQDAIDAFGDQ